MPDVEVRVASSIRTTAVALVVGVAVGGVCGWLLRSATDEPAGDVAGIAKPKAPVAAAASASRSEREPAPRGDRPSRTRNRSNPETAAVQETRDRGSTLPHPESPAELPDAPGGRRGTPRATAPDPRAADVAALATSAPGAGDVSAPPAASPSDDDPKRASRGLVLDVVTQQPIAGARVLHAAGDEWWGDTTQADGTFRIRADRDLGAAEVELRISKDGYEPARIPAAKGPFRVELRPRTTPVLPGRVAGVARTVDGRPVAGEIDVEGFDAQGNNATQTTVADAAGAFVLDGVPAGPWRFRIARGKTVEATVPEDGQASVELGAPDAASASNHVVTDIDPSTLVLDDPAAKARLAELRALLASVDTTTRLDADARGRLRRSIAQEMQRLADAQAAALPRRDVVVSGLPAQGRSWLRAETRLRHFRRVEAQAGIARFPSLPAGTYTLVLVVPGAPERSMPLVVTSGDGPFEAAFR